MILLVVNIIYPSYLSVQLACKQDYELNEDYVVSGYFNPQDVQITIVVEECSPFYPKVIKHELTHFIQLDEERLYSCVKKGFSWGLFFNEIEAYLSEYGFYDQNKMNSAYSKFFGE